MRLRTFTGIPDIGQGVLLFTSNEGAESLYRSMSGEYVLVSGATELLLTEEQAYKWSESRNFCISMLEFRKAIEGLFFGTGSYEDRSISGGFITLSMADSGRNYHFTRFIELIQLPAFRGCTIKCEGWESCVTIWSDELDFLQLSYMLNVALDPVFHEGNSFEIYPGQDIEIRKSSNPYLYIVLNASVLVECGYALASSEFPFEFADETPAVGFWIKAKGLMGTLSRNDSDALALIGLALTMAAVIVYELACSEPLDRTQLPDKHDLYDWCGWP